MRNRDGLISQSVEARAASIVRALYSGTLSRPLGGTWIWGHVQIDATAATQIVVIDDSINWKDRIVTINAFTPSVAGAGVPNADPWLCTATQPAPNNYILRGQVWLTAGGWNAIAPAGGINKYSFCNMMTLDTEVHSNVTFYADSVTGDLKIRVTAGVGQNRGIVYMIHATEHLGYQTAIP